MLLAHEAPTVEEARTRSARNARTDKGTSQCIGHCQAGLASCSLTHKVGHQTCSRDRLV